MRALKVSILVSIVTLLYLLVGVEAQTLAADPELALVASSPFQMVLSPTASELDYPAMQLLEEAIGTALLVTQSRTKYIDMDVVIQKAEFLEVSNELPATQIRFFALATTIVEPTDQTGTAQKDLNALIETSIADPIVQANLVQQLRSNDVLGNVSKVAIKAIVPGNVDGTGSTNGSSKKKLTSLDIILIVVSSAIFLGIAYMVIQHIKDRGYIENMRLLAFNATSTTGAPNNDGVSAVKASNDGTKEKKRSNEEEAPSTPSTTNSVNDVEIITPDATGRPKLRITAVTTAMPSYDDPIISAASLEGSSAMNENFDNNWFQKMSKNKRASDGYESSGASSEDLFHVAVDDTCDASSAFDERSKASSKASAVNEWLKTIRVVTTGSKGSLTDSTGSRGRSSTEPSLDNSSSLENSSLEQTSLEQSMASSSLGEHHDTRKMEV